MGSQRVGHDWATELSWTELMLGKIERRRRRGKQRMRWLDGITDSMDMSLSKLWSWWWTGRPGVLQSMGSQRAGHDWATELSWTDCHSRWNWEKISKFLVILVSKSAVWTISLRITKRNSMILDHLEVSRLMNHCYMIFFFSLQERASACNPWAHEELYHTLFQKRFKMTCRNRK